MWAHHHMKLGEPKNCHTIYTLGYERSRPFDADWASYGQISYPAKSNKRRQGKEHNVQRTRGLQISKDCHCSKHSYAGTMHHKRISYKKRCRFRTGGEESKVPPVTVSWASETMLPREEDEEDEDEAERTATRDETFTPKFTLLRPRQTGNERTPMPTTHGELDDEAVPTAAICLLGAAIAPATPASTTTIAIATPKPSIPVSVSRSLPPTLYSNWKKTHNSIGIPVRPQESVRRPEPKSATVGSRGGATKFKPPPLPWL